MSSTYLSVIAVHSDDTKHIVRAGAGATGSYALCGFLNKFWWEDITLMKNIKTIKSLCNDCLRVYYKDPDNKAIEPEVGQYIELLNKRKGLVTYTSRTRDKKYHIRVEFTRAGNSYTYVYPREIKRIITEEECWQND